MAIQVDRSLTQLQKMAKDLNLSDSIVPSGKNGRLMKEDLINPIRDHYLTERYKSKDKTPEHMKLILDIKSPMLAKRIDSLKPEEQEIIWESDDYDLEEKLNGCFEGNTEILLADGSVKKIKDIVKEGKPVRVSTFDSDGNICTNTVVNFFDNGLKPKKDWLCVKLGKGNSKYSKSIIVTKNHGIYTPEGFKPAQDLAVGDTVFTSDIELSDMQKDVCVGTLLGDSCLVWERDIECFEQGYALQSSHCEKQKPYLNLKYSMLSETVSRGLRSFVSGYGTPQHKFSTRFMKCFEFLRPLFYDGDCRSLHESIVISPLSLAIWYLDDGSISRGQEDGNLNTKNIKSRASISCARYSIPEVEIILNSILLNCNLEGKLTSYDYLGITFTADMADKFFSLISPYVPKCMEYKLPLKYQGGTKIKWWESKVTLGLYPRVIQSIREVDTLSYYERVNSIRAYDIEVENTHTYFANSFAVHNSRMCIVKTNEGLFLYSRHNSVKDLLPIEYSGKILYPDCFDLDKIKENFILDTEITSDIDNLDTCMGKYGVVTETMLQAVTAILNCEDKKAKLIQKQEGLSLTFNFFDCIFYEGQWITKEPLRKRRQLARELGDKLIKAGFNIRPVRTSQGINKKTFYKDIILNGGEGCFKGNMLVTLEDGSYERIDRIVKERMNVRVKSYNFETGKIEPKRIVGWYDNGLKSIENWVSVRAINLQCGGRGTVNNEVYNSIICTKNHKFATDFSGSYKPIQDVFLDSPLLSHQKTLNSLQKSILLGCILGDGTISYVKNSDSYTFSFGHSEKYQEYFNFKYSIFKSFLGGVLTSKSGKGSTMLKSTFHHRATISNFLSTYYDIDNPFRKLNLDNILKDLDDLGFAILFMDDGSKRGRLCGISLHTEGLSLEDVMKLHNWILTHFGGSPTDIITKTDKRVVNGAGISLILKDTLCSFIFKRIGKYIIPPLRYKMGKYADFYPYVPLESEPPKETLVAVPLKKCKDLISYKEYSQGQNLRAYDIEVEDNHNYFVNGILVHNCIAKPLEGIYVPDTSRGKKGWIKIKRSMSEMSTLGETTGDDMDFAFGNAFGDTIDGWISGFEPGNPNKGLKDYVGAIKVSTYVRDKEGSVYIHEIARISGFDMVLRQDMTETIGGRPQLKASFYNRVVEIDGAGVSARERRLNHAVLLGFRYDKNKDDCILEESFLESQVL